MLLIKSNDDMKSLAFRAYPELPEEDGLLNVANFILGYKQLWHDAGNQDNIRKATIFAGAEPLYLDAEHRQLNPNITERDYLAVFKQFERRWAARQHEGSPETNWQKAGIELAKFIKEYLKNQSISG